MSNKTISVKSVIKQMKREMSICRQCTSPASIASLCETHWFKQMSSRHTGSSKNWKLLKDSFEMQKRKCFYTGIDLVPGVNASLDHSDPKSRGGDNSPWNLTWVDKRINRMKTDFSRKEFIAMCKLVVAYDDPKGVLNKWLRAQSEKTEEFIYSHPLLKV